MTGSDAIRAARLWGGVAVTYDTVIPFFRVLGRRLVDALDPQPGERVLDIATGRGACLFPAAERVRTGGVVGIDVSTEMLIETSAEIAARSSTGTVALIAADAQRLAVAGGAFDVVMCSQAIGQLPDVVAAAREFRRVMCDGARIGIQRDLGHDRRWNFLAEVYRDVVGPTPPPSPPITVESVLEQAGFIDVERRQYAVEFMFPDEHAWWVWVRTTGAGLRTIEPLAPDVQAAYRDAVFERMQLLRTPDGFPIAFDVELVLARR